MLKEIVADIDLVSGSVAKIENREVVHPSFRRAINFTDPDVGSTLSLTHSLGIIDHFYRSFKGSS